MSLRTVRRALCLAALPCVAGAQTWPTDNPTLKRIYTLGMDSSWTQKFAHTLLDSIGPRLTGTALQKVANDWLVTTYKSWGVSARNEQVGTWRGWRRGWSHIDLVTPRQRTLEGTMLGFSPGTGGKAMTASTIVLPRFADSTEFVRWLPQAKGKLVLVSAPMPSCRPVEDWATNATPASKARFDSTRRAVVTEWGGQNVRGTGYGLAIGTGALGKRLDEAGVGGVVTSRPKDAWGTIEIFETYNTKAPAVTLSCEDYGLVFRLTESGAKPTLRLDLDAELPASRPCSTRSPRSRASEKPNEYVMLSAHFDSWDGSSGATDNGTGTIAMLEAMRILKTAYPKPKRTILVGHWIGEEQGLNGSTRVHGGPSRGRRRAAGAVQPGQRHGARRADGRRRTAERRGAPDAVARADPDGAEGADQLRRRRDPVGRAAATTPRSRATARRRSGSARWGGTTAATPGTRTATPTTRSCSTTSSRTRR